MATALELVNAATADIIVSSYNKTMARSVSNIRLLPVEVQSQIKAAVTILSLNDAIIAIVQNSIDAGARKIRVELDYAKGYCCVTDDGQGIAPEEFAESGGLGKMFYTSKQGTTTYGHYGRFLTCLGAMCLLTITSRHASVLASTLTIHHTGVINRLVGNGSNVDIGDQGTTVTVRNLFGNLPVRLSHLATRFSIATEVDKEFEVLKRMVVALELACPSNFQIWILAAHGQKYDNGVGRLAERTFDLRSITTLLQRARYTAKNDQWVAASAKSSNMSVRAIISLAPVAWKHVQFMSVGQHPLPADNSFTELINDLFEQSSFGMVEEDVLSEEELCRRAKDRRFTRPDHSDRQLRGTRKSVDRWPMFYVRIDVHSRIGGDRLFEGAENVGLASEVSTLLRNLINQFLSSNRLCATQPRREDRSDAKAGEVFRTWSRVKAGNPYCGQKSTLRQALGSDKMSTVPPGRQALESATDSDGDRYVSGRPEILIGKLALQKLSDQNLNLQHVSAQKQPFDESALVWFDHLGRKTVLESRTGPIHGPEEGKVRAATQASTRTSLFHRHHACFRPQEPPIPSVLSTDASSAPAEMAAHGVCKEDLSQAKVIGQVEKKFILAKIANPSGDLLVLIDQHAADERIKVEKLMLQLEETLEMKPPLLYDAAEMEKPRLRGWLPLFNSWGISFEVGQVLTVSKLPVLVAERCRADPKVLIDLIRREIWKPQPAIGVGDWISRLSCCPGGLVDLVNSRACRSAVMFGDELSNNECEYLVSCLGKCRLPFQCAHGRPSMVAIGKVGM